MTTFIAADWSVESAKRAVCVAETINRRVRRVALTHPSLERVLDVARASAAPVVVGFDCAIGVPESYLRATQQLSFLAVLDHLAAHPSFGKPVASATQWRLDRPFFRVPPGKGSRSGFEAAAEQQGVTLLRAVEVKTGANPVFITSGIPGSVGSGALSLWRELAAAVPNNTFSLWPFHGADIGTLSKKGVVVGEIYPRVAYAIALLDEAPDVRPRLRVAKSVAAERASALAALQDRPWIKRHQVKLDDLDAARADEDVFDAYVTAAAFLRCALEDVDIGGSVDVDVVAEGGILLSNAVNLGMPERIWSGAKATPTTKNKKTAKAWTLPCPIPGCIKVFHGTRGGWDSHVGALSKHPTWHPTVTDEAKRRILFRDKFPDFFDI